MKIGLPEREGRCSTCEYFVPHYIWLDGRCMPINDGHCIQRRMRRRGALDPVCEHWTAITEQTRDSRRPGYGRGLAPGKEYLLRVQVVEEIPDEK